MQYKRRTQEASMTPPARQGFVYVRKSKISNSTNVLRKKKSKLDYFIPKLYSSFQLPPCSVLASDPEISPLRARYRGCYIIAADGRTDGGTENWEGNCTTDSIATRNPYSFLAHDTSKRMSILENSQKLEDSHTSPLLFLLVLLLPPPSF